MKKQAFLDFQNFNSSAEQNFDALKKYNGKIYTGMKVGGTHKWIYNGGLWLERKITPEKWEINYKSLKNRTNRAPPNTGAKTGTGYHWYIIADQKAFKLNSNVYETQMNGLKFKVGHKRPNWKYWSYEYPEQKSYKEKVIEFLENVLEQLKNQY